MELQLGLALPGIPIKGLDLNSYGYEPKELFGSDTLNHEEYSVKKKRSFDEAFDNVQVPQTLPLLFWDKQREEEDDDLNGDLLKKSFTNKKNDGDENGVIGWPPIKSGRKKLCYQKHGGIGGGRSNSKYVKVKMEGVAIARKVDVSLHHSYQTLILTLVGMFGKCQENLKAYKLTYQDNEGDWLLAGYVPWGTFIKSVQRLKLLKNSG